MIRSLPAFSPALALLAALSLLFPLAACTTDDPGPTSLDPVDTLGPPASLEISGALTAQAGGSTVILSATVKDSAGNQLPSAPVTWSSSDSIVATVTAAGVVTPRRIGSVVLTASAGPARDTVTFVSSLTPYHFFFADTTPASDRRLIQDAVQDAHAFQLAALGRVLADSTAVTATYAAPGCANPGASAFAGGRTITVCLGNQGWKAHGPVIRQKILQHELFHIWQFAHWGNNMNASSAWIIEGSAELMGFRGVAARGLLDFPTALGCQAKEAADFTNRQPPGPPLPALSGVETRQAFQSTQGPLYTHSMLALDYLAGTQLTVVRAYGDSLAAGKSWQVAFEAAFGKSTAAFYAEFPGYLAGLAVPAAYLCRI